MSDNVPPGMSVDNWAFPPQPPTWPSLPPTPPPKRTSRSLPLAAAIIGTIIIGALGGVAVAFVTRQQVSTPGAGATATPGLTAPNAATALALYQRAVVAMTAAPGFHYVSVATGPDSETITGDAGVSGGRQLITFNASYGAEQFTLILVNGIVYFQGNAPAVEDQLGVATADAAKLAGKWVSVSNGDGPYSVLQPGITVADQAQEIPLTPASSSRITTAGGVAGYRIDGTIPASGGAPEETAHLDVIAASKIPVAYDSSFTDNGVAVTNTVTFSAWGTAPTVSAPTGAVAWSTLVTTEPAGGYGSGGTSSLAPTPTPQGAI
jgi:hypothetical protein